MVAHAMPHPRRRDPGDTVPTGHGPPTGFRLDGGIVSDERLALLIRDAVRQEGRVTENGNDMRDKALFVLAVAALATIVALATALGFTLWGPG